MSVRRSALFLLATLGVVTCSDEPVPTAPEKGGVVQGPAGGVATGRFVPGRVLVRFKPGARGLSVAASHGAVVGARILNDVYLLGVERGRELSTVESLRKSPDVVFAEPDWLRTFDDPLCTGCTLPGDTYFGLKWDLHNDGDVELTPGSPVATTGAADADMDWLEAFDHLGPSMTGSARIGIMDTGIRRTHEDLVGRVAAEFDFDANDPDASDDQGHGTHVAGISGAAGDNEVGLAGVAYGPDIGFVIAKVCHVTLFGLSAECPSSALSAGIRWAVDNGANVINISLGGTDVSLTEQEALQYARQHDVLPFCAAGNNSQGSVLYPGKFPECVAVSATDWGDGLASYSNFGPEVELSAPGGDGENSSGYSQIASTCFGANDEYCYKAGTSMATPQATGLGALLYALGLTDDEAVLDRMRDTADDLGPAGWDEKFGHGRINVYAAVSDLSGGDPNEPPTAAFSYTCDGLTCDFTDASSDPDGSIVARSWTFGDGASSTLQNPSHTYACSGTYSVSLRVTDNGGRSRSTSQSVTVSASVDPDGPGTIPGLAMWLQADKIQGLSDADPVATWADQSGSCNNATQSTASKRPTYRVNQLNGLPAVFFDASDDGMATPVDPPTSTTIFSVYSSRAAQSGYLLNGGPSFFMGPYVNRYRVYTGQYITGPAVTAGRWIFQTFRQSGSLAQMYIDGSAWGTTKRLVNPSTILLARQGTYSARLDGYVAELLVYTRTLTDGEVQSVHDWLENKYIGPPPPNQPPTAAFAESCDGLACAFTDQSTDADGSVVAWSWAFGDGATSTSQSPSHSYAAAGTYTVTLTATDDDGATDDVSGTVTVTVPPPNEPPTAGFAASCTDLNCTFTDQSTDADGSVVAWSWAFGDGATATSQSPSHSYAAAGTYTVTLTVTDDDGDTDEVSSPVTVTEPPPGSFEGPGSIPDLSLWLDASAIQGLADGSPVATWPDRSGLGNDATQSTASKRPVYRTNQVAGSPAVFFDATDDGMATPVNPATATTIVAVYSSRAAQSGYLLNGGFSFFMGPYVGVYRTYTGSYLNGPGVTGGRWLIQTFRQSGSLAEQFIDGGSRVTTTRVTNPGVILLARQGTYSSRLDGSVAEFLIYNRTLTDQELQDLHGWLKARYGIP
ncbi:MAG: PKD domain-containing protein [Gemmatimonadota bacterium]